MGSPGWTRTQSGLLVRKEGVDVGQRGTVNLIEGSGVTLTVTDDVNNDEVDVTIAATAASSGATTQIAQTVLGSAAASISFTSIAGTYETLRVVLTGRSAVAANSDTVILRFNNDSGTNYDWQSVIHQGATSTPASSTSQTQGVAGVVPGTSTTGGVGQTEVVIPGYARTTFQKTCHASMFYYSAGTTLLRTVGTLWKSTAAITRVDLIGNGGNLAAGTVATLYGID